MLRQRKSKTSFRLMGLVAIGIVVGIIFGLYRFVFAPSIAPTELPPLRPPASSIPSNQVVDATSIPEGDYTYPVLFIPSAGVREAVVESRLDENGWRVNHLGNRIGHLEGTNWLGEIGNIVLAGHVELADGSRGVFSEIEDLNVGDQVTLIQNGVEHHYFVTEIKRVDNSDLSVVYPTDSNRVTLITCSNYNFLSDTYERRVVVVAEQRVARANE